MRYITNVLNDNHFIESKWNENIHDTFSHNLVDIDIEKMKNCSDKEVDFYISINLLSEAIRLSDVEAMFTLLYGDKSIIKSKFNADLFDFACKYKNYFAIDMLLNLASEEQVHTKSFYDAIIHNVLKFIEKNDLQGIITIMSSKFISTIYNSRIEIFRLSDNIVDRISSNRDIYPSEYFNIAKAINCYLNSKLPINLPNECIEYDK